MGISSIGRLVNRYSPFLVQKKRQVQRYPHEREAAFLLALALQRADRADVYRILRQLETFERFCEIPSSQSLQDCFALAWVDSTHRTFVDVGAGHAQTFSNSYCLQQLGWRGLLIEPNRKFGQTLLKRVCDNVQLETVAAGSRGVVGFADLGELSSCVDNVHANAYVGLEEANAAETYEVSRVPLDDLLAKHFDDEFELGFLSLDVEGAELDVLHTLDLSVWSFQAICVEHNYRPSVEAELDVHFAQWGYRRVLSEFSGWDAWYCPEPV